MKTNVQSGGQELAPEPAQVSRSSAFLCILVAVGLLAIIISGNGSSGSSRTYMQAYAFGTHSSPAGGAPGKLVEDCDGALYATTSSEADLIFRFDPEHRRIAVVYSLSTGAEPRVGLGAFLVSRKGFLFGTTAAGGNAGLGTIFRVKRDGTGFKTLHSFGSESADGRSPAGALAVSDHGALYGTTSSGGQFKRGILFSVSEDGISYDVLHHFGGDMDGSNPQAGVVILSGQVVFGTTVNGGIFNAGCVFRYDLRENSYAVLHHFGETDFDGANPYCELVLSGNTLYGTSSAGGTAGFGTIFRLETDGSDYSVLHHFRGRDGAFPHAALVRGPDNYLYGTAPGGGEMRGTIFKLKDDGTRFRTLHKFESIEADGANAFVGLVVSRGALFGTTKEGGSAGSGTIFTVRTR